MGVGWAGCKVSVALDFVEVSLCETQLHDDGVLHRPGHIASSDCVGSISCCLIAHTLQGEPTRIEVVKVDGISESEV